MASMNYFLNMLYIYIYEKGTLNVKFNMIRYMSDILLLGTVWRKSVNIATEEFEPRSWRDVLETTLWDKVCKWLATAWWFSLGTTVSSTNKTDRHDITEILLKVALKRNKRLTTQFHIRIIHTLYCKRIINIFRCVQAVPVYKRTFEADLSSLGTGSLGWF
jgi:hypothetical protein